MFTEAVNNNYICATVNIFIQLSHSIVVPLIQYCILQMMSVVKLILLAVESTCHAMYSRCKKVSRIVHRFLFEWHSSFTSFTFQMHER